MRVSFLIVLMSCSLIGLETQVFGQSLMRGMDQNVDLKATGESIQMELIVEEIEDAGFTLDIEEGFEEEWEEEIWISSEDELGAADIDLDDAVLATSEDISEDDLDDDWEEIIWEDEASVELVATEDSWSIEDRIEEDFEEEGYDDILMEDLESLGDDVAEDTSDPGWDEIIEEIELDDMEMDMEEDLDLLEEIFNAM